MTDYIIRLASDSGTMIVYKKRQSTGAGMWLLTKSDSGYDTMAVDKRRVDIDTEYMKADRNR